MATTSRRDVKLVVTTETEGEGKLKGLAADLRDMATTRRRDVTHESVSKATLMELAGPVVVS